jgi:hypothetical protein
LSFFDFDIIKKSRKEKKMYKKIFILTVIVILFAGYAGAEVARDGVWWNNLEMGQKQMYLEAVSGGIGLAPMVVFHDKNVDKKCQALVDGSYKSYLNNYFTHVTTTQIFNGLDLFYSNSENLNIGTEKAFWIVLKTIHGDPENEINDLIKTWRK